MPDSNGEPETRDLQEINDPNSRFTNKAQRCQQHVKQKSPGKNAYAICTASMGYDKTYRAGSKRK